MSLSYKNNCARENVLFFYFCHMVCKHKYITWVKRNKSNFYRKINEIQSNKFGSAEVTNTCSILQHL